MRKDLGYLIERAIKKAVKQNFDFEQSASEFAHFVERFNLSEQAVAHLVEILERKSS